MVFRRDNKYRNNREAAASVYYKARRVIIFYKFGSSEEQLDRYFRKIYRQPLRYVCLRLLNNCSVSTDTRGTVITFRDNDLDKLARLITYGTGKLNGSKILRRALG